MEIFPVAHIKNDYVEKFGIPRQSGKVKNLSYIIFEEKYRHPDAIREIESFSHLWLIFDFSMSHRSEFIPTVRPPRLGGNKKVGVFASRSPFRPNSMGISCVKLIEVKKDSTHGNILVVEGADLLNNTPIYDIKPYIPYSDCKPNAKKGYTTKNSDYKLKVVFNCSTENIPKEKIKEIKQILSEDPRPSYKEESEKIYKMKYADFDISFKVINKTTYILSF